MRESNKKRGIRFYFTISILTFSGFFSGSILSGIFPLIWEKKPTTKTISSVSYNPLDIDARQIRKLQRNSDYVIIDVRSKKEYDMGHIEGAAHADYFDAEALKRAAGDKIPITYCTYSTWRGPYAAYELYKQGYKTVGIADGGITGFNTFFPFLKNSDGIEGQIAKHPLEIFPTKTPDEISTVSQTANIDITASQFQFSPSIIKVKKGTHVVLQVVSADVIHGMMIPTLGIHEELLPGVPKKIEFDAKTAGTYPFVCSIYCGHEHTSMVGEIVVE